MSTPNGYGDENKMFSVVFLVDEWSGQIIEETDETTNAKFFAIDELPEIPELYRETINDLKTYKEINQVILK
jgi:hypothetical protein